jgi:uncharacterized protein (UPF0261 family)/predicted TIM-barrel enzyme
MPEKGGTSKSLYCIGTLDTKGPEVHYLAECLSSAVARFQLDVQVVIVDVSTTLKTNGTHHASISNEEVIANHPEARNRSISSLPSERGEAIATVSLALVHLLKKSQSEGKLAGAIGVGGSCGTALIAPALRALPLGLPKVLISTVASGNTSAYIKSSDLVLFPSVVDIAGLNSLSWVVLANAAGAAAGMVATSELGIAQKGSTKPTVGLTMFGVTTPCVDAVRFKLEEHGYETMVFHATGTGGRAMENLVAQGLIQGVIDISTTEVADYVVGGIMACSPNRFQATLNQGIPFVLSVGALDMVNFGNKSSVPSQFANRKLHLHNDQITVMRTTVKENLEFAKFIAEKLNMSTAPVRVVLPEKGVSQLDHEGMPFYDPQATETLLNELEKSINKTADCQVKRLPYHINDPEFADALVKAFLELSHTTGVAQQPREVAPPMNIQTIKPKLVKMPTSNFSHANPATLKARENLIQKLRKQIARGIPIIGAGAGTGISAKFEEEGGADLIVIYNSGRFRMAGRGSLAGLMPFKDANAVVLEMASEVLPVVKRVPVLAGVCASDPFRRMDRFLLELERLGFDGIQNFPTVGLIDGNFRQNLEETGMGYGVEVTMIRQAHEMGFLTTPYSFNAQEAHAMAMAGADIVVAHMGLTTAGSIGAKTAVSLEDSVRRVQAIADAASEVNPDVIVLCHGGPISGPKEAEYVLQRTRGVHGFYGASSMERLPVEEAIAGTMQQYKAIQIAG